jgi:small neutral amino acid transporter SnatA (MarC family)
MNEVLIFFGWALKVLAIFGGLVLLTLAMMALAGNLMKKNAKKNNK